MKRLGISSTDQRENFEGIYFALAKDGFNTNKYYVYQETPLPPEQIVKRIVKDEVEGSTGVYRLIENDWYLYAKAISD